MPKLSSLAPVVAVVALAACSPSAASPPGSSSPSALPSMAAPTSRTASAAPETPQPVACPPSVDPPSPAASPVDAMVGPAVEGTLALFDEASVVAIGEYHGWVAQHEFFAALVCDPAFPRIVDAVVIEWANRRLQPILDRYVTGGDVSARELSSLWRESTQRSGVFDGPVYARLLGLLRAVNLGLPPGEGVRVLAGDPPIDWSSVDQFGDCSSDEPRCLDFWLFRRDESFAEVVIDDVLARGESALIIAGAGHMTRTPVDDERPPSVPDIIEAAHPGQTRVILPHHDNGATSADLERRIAAWPVPSLALLRGTWLGALDGCLLDDDSGGPGSPCPDGEGPTFADLADGYLYLGPG